MTPESGARQRTAAPQLRTIADYTICGRLGKGSMGVVYRAIDERTRGEVALKVIASDHEGDDEMRSRFFREAVVAGGLCHRNIVRVLDSGEDAGRLYIAMELLTGGTLTDYLKTEDADDLEARLDVMIQVCQGLLVAHDAGVYHRDIKPANLFVCDDRRVKIVDFGIARLAGSDMTTTGFILGTPDFMSPEQARGKQVAGRTDIFSAAAVFYLMLTRRKPFAAPDLPAVLAKVLKADPLPIRNDEAPEAIAAIVHKALSKDPAERQQNVAQLASELMAAASAVSASTLQMAAKVRVEAEELIALTNRRAELLKGLELPDPAEAPVWQGFARRYPALGRGPMALGSFPLRSGVVAAVAGEIRATIVPLRQVVTSLETGCAEWGRARELHASRNFDQAAERLAAARRAVPSSPRIARDIEGCAHAIEQRREQEALLDSRLKLAEEVAARRDWAGVLAIVSEVEDIDSGNVHAGRLRVHARQGLDTDRERTERDRSQRLASAAVNEARRAAAEGRSDEGVTALEAYLQANPNAPVVADAIETLRRDAQAAVVRADHVTRAASLIEQARRQFAESNLADAEQTAAQSIALNGEDQDARRLLADIRTAIHVKAEKQNLSRRVEDLLARARQLAARNNFAKALAAADEALKLDVEHPDATQLRARIIADRSSREMGEKQEALRSARLASRLALAQNAVERRDWDTVVSLTAEID
ncbi:MAG: protein kinase, partial [Vicinamibacterales bacterium]